LRLRFRLNLDLNLDLLGPLPHALMPPGMKHQYIMEEGWGITTG